MNFAQTNWDDLRFILAVADCGSVSAAATRLGVNHATVLRRINAFETRNALTIFDRTSRGDRRAMDQRPLGEAMREAGKAVMHVDQMIESVHPRKEETVRITSTDSFCQYILAPDVLRLQAATAVSVELIAANSYLDLGMMQADVTVRPSPQLPDDLAGEQAGWLWFAVYGTDPKDDQSSACSARCASIAAATALAASGKAAQKASPTTLKT